MTNEQAIEKLREFCKLRTFCELYPDACQKDKCEIYMAIEALSEPSRQGQRDGLIKRQDIYDLINNWNGSMISKSALRCEVEYLPPAQPERTCVNCGRTVNNGGWYADGRTRCPIEEHYALPKDGYCHLWEKRNVTDDDYPERRTDE